MIFVIFLIFGHLFVLWTVLHIHNNLNIVFEFYFKVNLKTKQTDIDLVDFPIFQLIERIHLPNLIDELNLAKRLFIITNQSNEIKNARK